MKALGIDADDLSEAIKHAVKEADRAKSTFKKWGESALLINSLSHTIGALNSVVQDLTDSFKVQEEAEARLEVSMRNALGATEEQIQSIKDLCSEQQKLGVIGDEVQLQGAQKHATFIETTDALREPITLFNVPHFSGILIHPGNTAKDTEGCILVGKNTVRGRLTDSTATFFALYDIMRGAAAEGRRIWITII